MDTPPTLHQSGESFATKVDSERRWRSGLVHWPRIPHIRSQVFFQRALDLVSDVGVPRIRHSSHRSDHLTFSVSSIVACFACSRNKFFFTCTVRAASLKTYLLDTDPKCWSLFKSLGRDVGS